MFGLFMYSLDTTIINVALPSLGAEFHAGTDLLEWAITGYLLSLAIWIPASGWIGDRFGTKKTFMLATALFMIGSALCGRAWSIESLAFFRVIQGAGGGMMTPVGTAMLYRAFTIQERAQASAMIGIPTQVAPMLGPLLGGFLVDRVNWRWIFYVNLPVGALSFLFAWVMLKEHREEQAGRFDPAGFVLSGFAVAGLLLALSRGPNEGWTSPHILFFGIGGLLCLTLLIVVELRNPTPMLDLSLFGGQLFRNANIMAGVMFAAQNSILFLLPLYLQDLRGLSALDSGLVTAAQPLPQYVAGHHVKLRTIAEVGGGEAIDRAVVAGGHLLKRGPQLGHFIAREGIEDARTVAPRAHQADPKQMLEVLRRVRDALPDLFGDRLDGAFALRQQVDDLSATPACERLGRGDKPFVQRILARPVAHGSVLLQRQDLFFK